MGLPKINLTGSFVALAMINTLAIMGGLGFMAYSRLVYKRPVITEDKERVRLTKVHASPTPIAAPGLVIFDPITVNIQSMPAQPKPADGTNRQIHGKMHYVTAGFAIEVRDINQKEKIERVRPILLDKILWILGHKSFSELTTVQGRYILRTQILEMANQLFFKDPELRKALATNVYFTQFFVQ